MAIGIIRFPGTNCDRDVYKANLEDSLTEITYVQEQ